MKRNWTAEEEEYLRENWGRVTVPRIAKALGRSVDAVKVRVARLGLGPYLENGDYVTFNQLLIAVCGTNAGASISSKAGWRTGAFPFITSSETRP